MYLHMNLRHLKCLRTDDAGSEGEYYFTYQLFSDSGDSTLIHQGFSRGCPIDDGYSLAAGQQVETNDPKFTVELPELEEGETRRIYIDVHAWESDHASDEVKKVFTNETVTALQRVYSDARGRRKEAMSNFEDWLSDSDNQFLSALATAAPGVGQYVTAAKAVIPLIKHAVALVKSNSDDFLGSSRASLIYSKQDGRLSYRWVFNQGVETWIHEEEAPVYYAHRFREASGGNELDTKFIFQTILDPDGL